MVLTSNIKIFSDDAESRLSRWGSYPVATAVFFLLLLFLPMTMRCSVLMCLFVRLFYVFAKACIFWFSINVMVLKLVIDNFSGSMENQKSGKNKMQGNAS